VCSFALRLAEFVFVEWHASQTDSDDVVNLLDRCIFSLAQNCRRSATDIVFEWQSDTARIYQELAMMLAEYRICVCPLASTIPVVLASISSSASGGVDAKIFSMCERGEPWKSCRVDFPSGISRRRSNLRRKSSSNRDSRARLQLIEATTCGDPL
jgi:hypothetical protein